MRNLIFLFSFTLPIILTAQESRDIQYFTTKALEKIISLEEGCQYNKHIFILQEYDQYHKENKYVNDLTKQPHISIDSLIHMQIYDACHINTQSRVHAMSKDIAKYIDFNKFQHARLYMDRIYKINDGEKAGLLLPFYITVQDDPFEYSYYGYVYANWYSGFLIDFKIVYPMPITTEPHTRLIQRKE